MRMLDRAARALLSFLGAALIVMICLTVYNVIARYVFNRALLWGDEVAVYAMIAVTWLGALICAWRNAEIRMDLLINLLGPRGLRLVHIAQQAVIAVLCAWVAWQALPYVARTWKIGMRSDAANLPVWLIHAVIPFSLALIAVIAAVRCLRLIAGHPLGFTPEARVAAAAETDTLKGQAG